MNKYKSFLAPQLQQYVIYRHNLSYSMKASLSHLKTFDRYLMQKQAQQVLLQPSFFMRMQADLKIEARSVNNIVASVRFSLTIRSETAYISKTRSRTSLICLKTILCLIFFLLSKLTTYYRPSVTRYEEYQSVNT